MMTNAMINEARLVSLFCELVEIDSPSRAERQLADRLSAIFERLGFAVAEDDAGVRIGGNCGNIYARLYGSLPLAPILFSCHMDTVEPCRGKRAVVGPDDVIRSAGGTVLGADNLAGITAVLEAVECIRSSGKPHRTIEVLLSVAEELHLSGSHWLEPSRLTAREAYVLDTSGPPGRAVLQAPGHIGLTFDVFGQAAHAGIDPEAGISAIRAAALGIASLRTGRVDELTTANIGRIEGGGETNIVADHCRVTAECRSLNLDRLKAVAEEMKSIMARAAAAVGARIETMEKLSYLPYNVSENQPVVSRFREVCAKLGLPVSLIVSGGGSDNNVLALHGIDGIVIACGMNKVHTREEQIRIADLADTARLVLGLIESP